MFDWYVDWDYEIAAAQLILAMFGMGAALTPQNFWGVFRERRAFLVGIACQLLLVPAIIVIAIYTTDVGAKLAVGLALLAAMPGGAASNIIVYFGRGHVPLSVSLTAVMTIVCLLTTPLLFSLLLPAEESMELVMPHARVVLEMFAYLLVPLAIGMILFKNHPNVASKWSQLAIRISFVLLGVVVAGSLSSGRVDLARHDLATIATLIGLPLVALYITKVISGLCGFPFTWAHTLAVETTQKNINLAVLLVISLFPDTTTAAGGLALFTVLAYGGASLSIVFVDACINRFLVNSGAQGPWGLIKLGRRDGLNQ